MAESIAPSPELRRLLADLCQFEIPADAIQKFEIEPTKDGIPRDQIDVSTITWPPQQDALVREVTERAVEESTLKILQLAAKSKEWNAKTLVLRKGSLVPFPGEISLIVPLIRAHSSFEKVSFYFIKDKSGPSKAWKEELYILKPGTCIRVMEGELRMIAVVYT
ncbi:hypothetical protein F5Y14DRAFT_445845 [Nemania sp. NC0429]|nr:hypothetical protein F5Y14DRAFT_445845 [Nemania sp. NC0429]